MLIKRLLLAALAAGGVLSAPSVAQDRECQAECDGGKPQFQIDSYQAWGAGQVIMATQWRLDDTEGVINAYDLAGQGSAPLGSNWATGIFHHPDWVRSKMGQLFGVALDNAGNVYTAHTAVYWDDQIGSIGGNPGQVYKIDTFTGAVSVFASLPNVSDPVIAASAAGVDESYPGLGNLCFDVDRQVLYVSNFEDGRIYRVSGAGVCLSTWDHATGIVGSCAPEPGDGPGAARLGERVWAVQNLNDRLYYSLWIEDAGQQNASAANQIWSIQIDGAGEFIAGTEQLELNVPPHSGNYSNPVSDIAFNERGNMMLAERSMSTNTSTGQFSTGAHQSRALEYACQGDGWSPSGNTFDVSGLTTHDAAGGCDYSYAPAPDDRVWFTADAMILSGSTALYGLQGVPQSGGDVTNSILIDMDGETTLQDKTLIGSLEVSCPGIPPADCAEITEKRVECDPDNPGSVRVSFVLTNLSGHTVEHLIALPSTPGVTVVPSGLISLGAPLPSGASTLVSLTFSGVVPGDVVCFALSLNTADFEECCVIEHCFEVPECECAIIFDEVADPFCDGTGCFKFSYNVQNLTAHDIFYSFFVPLSPAGVTIDTGNPADPSRWDYAPLLPPGGVDNVTLTICGAQPGEEVCFLMTLHNERLEECCSVRICVRVPECDADNSASECLADCNGDGVVNFFDVSMFLSDFSAQDQAADLNDDGSWNFFDLAMFMDAYEQGCP